MSLVWSMVPLGDVLIERSELPSSDAISNHEIRIVEKIGFNNGKIQLRLDGTTKTKMILIRPGDFVLSGINAAKGAVAIYGEENTEPIAATIHYGAYIPRKDRVDTGFLWWLLRSNTFRRLLDHHLPGGIKTELKAKRLLPIPIPLPPLSEQRRIVGRLEHLASKIEEARELSLRSSQEGAALIVSAHLKSAQDNMVRVGDFLKLEEHKAPVVTTERYPQVGIYSFGKGLFARGDVLGDQTAYKAFNRLFEGAFVLSQVKGWEGAVAVCSPNFAGSFVSPEYRTFRCVEGKAIPEYLAALTTTSWFHDRLKDLTQGAGARRERVRPELFLNLELPMPSVDEQKRITRGLSHLEPLKQLQAQTRAELEALLPSILDKAFRGEL